MNSNTPVYASFMQRAAAVFIDNLLFGIFLAPIILLFFEQPQFTEAQAKEILKTEGLIGLVNLNSLFFQQIIILCITVFFWTRFAATPGKKLMKISIVDATTLQPIGLQQSITRYLGWLISGIPFGLGFLWALIDKKNQAWHDKLANTLVISTTSIQHQSPSIPRQGKGKKDDDNIFAA